MEPLLKKWSPVRRAVAFVPFVILGALLAFLLVGFPTNQIAIAILVAPFAGVAFAWLLVGFPRVARKDGRPLVEPRVKPWLFFVAFPLYALFAYPFLGLALSPFLPPALVVYVPMGLALAIAGVGAYFTTGFPAFGKDVRDTWARVPPKTRPWLSIPIGLVLSLVLYFLIGWGLTAYLGVPWAPLAALPLGLVLGFTLAVLALGFPRPEKPVKDLVPRAPGNARPGLLVATWLLLGLPCAFAAGLALGYVPFVPAEYELAASLLIGFLLSFALAVLVWGLPGRWRKLPDYTPGVSNEVRVALVLPLTFAVAAVVAFALGLAGLDLLPSLLIGTVLGLASAVLATGTHRTLRQTRAPATIPEKVKPLLLFPTWIVLAAVVFVPLTWFLPAWFPINLAIALLVGFAVAFILVERDVLGEWRGERARKRALKADIRRIRAERLGAAPAAAASAPAPAAPPADAPAKRGFLARIGRKKKEE